MYTIQYVNFGYGPGMEFDSLAKAVLYGKNRGFTFMVYRGTEYVVAWCPIGGLTWYDNAERNAYYERTVDA